jgi:hypothetical protein
MKAKRLIEKTRLNMEQSYKRESSRMKSLDPLFKTLHLVALAKNFEGAAGPFFISSLAAYEGIIKDGKNLGLLSPDFERLCEAIADHLALLEEEKLGTGEILKQFLMSFFITGLGIMWLNLDSKDSGEYRLPENSLLAEMTMRVAIKSDLLLGIFESMLKASGLNANNSRFGSVSLESGFIIGIIAMMGPQHEIMEAMKERLLRNKEEIVKTLDNIGEEIDTAPLQIFLAQVEKALINNNFEPLIKSLNVLLKSKNIRIEALLEDAQAIKQLFKRLAIQLNESAEPNANVIEFVG